MPSAHFSISWPRLLVRFNPFVASLILGAFWGVWHLPAFFISSMVQTGLSLPFFLFNALCLSILATWFFQNTAGSALITVMFHYMLNFSASVLGVPLPALTVVSLIASVLMLDKRTNWLQKLSWLEQDKKYQYSFLSKKNAD
jgi:hypothetical protein